MKSKKFDRIVKKKQKALSIFHKTIASLKEALDEVGNARTIAIENRQSLRRYLEEETKSVNAMIDEENENIDLLLNEFKELEANITNLSGLFNTPLPQQVGAPKDLSDHVVPTPPVAESTDNRGKKNKK